jgi:hypothetical protein
MKSTYRVLAVLIALGVVFQAAAVGLAWFTVIRDIDGGAVIDKNYEGNIGHALHFFGGSIIPVLALLLFIVSFFAKVPGGVKWAGLVLGIAVLQYVLAFISFGIPAVGALHGLNALVLAAVAGMAGRRVTQEEGAAALPARTAV